MEHFGVARRIGAKLPRKRSLSHPREVEPIGIPAGLHGDVTLEVTAGVPRAGVGEELQPLVIEMELRPAQKAGEFRPAPPVLRIVDAVSP